MPQNLIEKLNIYVDQVIEDDDAIKKLDHGKELAGNVKQEFIIDKRFEFHQYFLKFLKDVTEAYILKITNQKISKFEVINSWIVRQFEGEYNPVHIHTGHLSGVGYLKVPDDWGSYSQNNKRNNQNGKIDFIYGNRAFLSNGNILAKPKVGDFYLFTNYLFHTVYSFKGAAERRSVSFNSKMNIYIIHNSNKQ